MHWPACVLWFDLTPFSLASADAPPAQIRGSLYHYDFTRLDSPWAQRIPGPTRRRRRSRVKILNIPLYISLVIIYGNYTGGSAHRRRSSVHTAGATVANATRGSPTHALWWAWPWTLNRLLKPLSHRLV